MIEIDRNILGNSFNGNRGLYPMLDPNEDHAVNIINPTDSNNIGRFMGSIVDSSYDRLSFTMNIKNSSVDNKVICLLPGVLNTKEDIKSVFGREVAGIIGDTMNEITVTSTTDVKALHRFIVDNPTVLRQIQVSVDDERQFSLPIEILGYSPFCSVGSRVFVPKSQQKSGDANPKLITMNFSSTHMNSQTLYFITVGAGRSVELTFFVGASFNPAAMFHKFMDMKDGISA